MARWCSGGHLKEGRGCMEALVWETAEELDQKLAKRVRNVRKRRSISQEKLAEISNLNRNFIGMIERGETNVTVKNLENIVNALGLPIQELFNFII